MKGNLIRRLCRERWAGRRAYSPPVSSAAAVAQKTRAFKYALVGVCGYVFYEWQTALTSASKRRYMLEHYTCSSRHLQEGRGYTLLTSVFSHKEAWHLAANLVTITSFADICIPVVGLSCTTAVFVLGGVTGALAQVMRSRANGRHELVLGASGGACAMTMLAACLMPKAPVQLMFVIPGRAMALIGALGLYDLGAEVLHINDGIAHVGHLGGMGVGLAAYALLRTPFAGRIGRARMLAK